MKKIISLLMTVAIIMSLVACGTNNQAVENTNNTTENINSSDNKISSEKQHTPVTINTSPDKYTWYIKDYVGKNCATIGYTSMMGDRMDKYGESILKLIFVTEDGSYVDFKNEEALKEYVVTGQNISPNSEMKLVFQKDSEEEEYSNLIDGQTYEEIVLSVRKVKEKSKNIISLTEIKPSPDKYTWYIADYVGRNLANCGYTSLIGDRRVKYGEGNIKLVLISDDGNFIELDDEETLKNYVVTSQSIAPNTELKLVFDKDDNGVEYSNIVDSQNIEEIELHLKKLVQE